MWFQSENFGGKILVIGKMLCAFQLCKMVIKLVLCGNHISYICHGFKTPHNYSESSNS